MVDQTPRGKEKKKRTLTRILLLKIHEENSEPGTGLSTPPA
jgi:hypothetical protein